MSELLRRGIESVRGVGPAHRARLEKLGLLTLEDALHFFPRDYEDRRTCIPVSAMRDGEAAFVRVTLGEQPRAARLTGGRTMARARAFDDSGMVQLTFFNNPYLLKHLSVGQEYDLYGRAEVRGSFRAMVNPLVERAGEGRLTGQLLPVYHGTAGLPQTLVRAVVRAALDAAAADGYSEVLPPALVQKYRLCPPAWAYEAIHNPRTPEDVHQARRRLIFEELLCFCCALRLLRDGAHGQTALRLRPRDPEIFFSALPFTPTAAQRRAVGEAFADLCGGTRMNRLLQGDVGSGKTLVAAACAWLAAADGRQTVIMAPTELLARQHAHTLSQLLAPFGCEVALLVGSLPAGEKRAVKARAEAGQCAVLCGTHALLQGDVALPHAALFVVDEQHRFGVRQRAALGGKEADGHLLVMSATPIPRTLTLILYGELDLSVLDELPPGRTPVETHVIPERRRGDLYRFIGARIAEGGQAYVVCPRIEGDGEADERRAAVECAAILRAALPAARVGLLHGRLRPAEKEAVMAEFACGALDVLVATTVIEVGVDVPNACVMAVENAAAFGLSQLHQLRGRVGRGARKSYCLLLDGGAQGAARERLAALARTNDGFAIAQEDLRLRGPGDFFGHRQHGLPDFRIADLAADVRVLQAAQDEAAALVDADPALAHAPLLRARADAVVDKTLRGVLS